MPDNGYDSPTQADVTRAAEAALVFGISVMPPDQDGSKRPFTRWKPYQERRPTHEELARWYGTIDNPRRTGLGFICGAVSGNLEALEFDRRGVAYGPFREAARATGLGPLVDRLDSGYAERSPSGGVHWLYRCAVIAGNTKLAEYRSEEEDSEGRPIVKAIIETRGEGGYVVVSPSFGTVHPSGDPYVLLGGGPDSIPTITPEEREMLFALARTFDEIPDGEKIDVPTDVREPGKPGKPPRADGDTILLSPGDDFNARTTWEDILEPHGWKKLHKQGQTVYWRRPGKDAGHSATENHLGTDRLRIFTSSSQLGQGESYSKFGAYTILRHAGDFAAATRKLSEEGYGTHQAWVKDETSECGWRLETFPNPCPRGRKLAEPGKGPPPDWRRIGTGAVKAGRGGLAHPPPPDAPPETPVVEVVPSPPQYPPTDLGNAERLVARSGRDIRYVHPWSKWLVWDGRRWAIDQLGAVRQLAKGAVREIYREAADVDDDVTFKALVKWAKDSEDVRKINAMVRCAESEKGVPVLPEHLDTNRWMLNCLNGTLDLKYGVLGPHLREDMITQLCPVEFDPSATCPDWESTLSLVFSGNQDLVKFWQMLCGLALTGDVSEQYLPILYGKGSNGKSTLVNTLMGMLGPDYAMKAPPDLLMIKKGDVHPTERVGLYGKRLVVAIETEEGRRINETMVKELTGSDPITARRMREDFWSFNPTHKLFLCTNHRPVIRGTDHAIWRRLQLIPFTVTIPDEDAIKDMPIRLEAEYPGILAWCVRGCRAWRDAGRLISPDAVTDATKQYRSEEDTIGEFLASHCVFDPQFRVKASDLYARYCHWTEGSGEFKLSQKRFGTVLTDRGFERRTNNGTWYLGLGLEPKNEEPGEF